MYDSFFQLTKRPFDLTPNPGFLYPSASYRKAKIYLDYGLKERAGFLVLTGEVGSGKTTLIRHMIQGLDAGISLAKVFNTKVNAHQLISMICEDFGLNAAGRDKTQLLRDLNDFLIKEYQQHRQSLLVIDEAQNLTPDLLEEVRMLSNLETDDSKLLQILLVGQPELAKALSLSELRQLRQRISIVCQLYPLSRQEMAEYISHRLEIAGNKNALQIAPEALDAIYGYSRGIPRLVNIVCGFALLTAFTEDSRVVSGEMAADIIESLGPQTVELPPDPGRDGKRTLLKALGTGQQNEGIGDRDSAASRQGNLKILLKDLSLRIAAVEKEFDQFPMPEVESIRQRITDLEKTYGALKSQVVALGARVMQPVVREEAPRASAAVPAERVIAGKESTPAGMFPRGQASPAVHRKENRT